MTKHVVSYRLTVLTLILVQLPLHTAALTALVRLVPGTVLLQSMVPAIPAQTSLLSAP